MIPPADVCAQVFAAVDAEREMAAFSATGHPDGCDCSECLGLDLTNTVDHPAHYGGANNPYEAIKVIEAWDLGFCLGNTVKYISRARKKDPAKTIEDLEKARWYLDREIARLKGSP
jgi:hypothetical protein